MKNLNWHQFFFRLTVVLSVAIGIIGGFVLYDMDPSPGAVVFGLLLSGGVWIIYFCIRWIYRGLKKG